MALNKCKTRDPDSTVENYVPKSCGYAYLEPVAFGVEVPLNEVDATIPPHKPESPPFPQTARSA